MKKTSYVLASANHISYTFAPIIDKDPQMSNISLDNDCVNCVYNQNYCTRCG